MAQRITAAEKDLMLAVKTGKEHLFERALAGGACLEVRDKSDFTPMMLAAIHQRPAIARLLIQRGAEVNAITDPFKFTALHLAVETSSPEVTRLLLENGAEVDALDSKKRPPLFGACEQGLLDQIQLLLRYGAKTNLLDIGGDTALKIALWGNHFESAKCLLAAGADIDQKLPDEITLLMRCAYEKSWECVQFLLNEGANPHLKNSNGADAFALAEMHLPNEDRWETYGDDFAKTAFALRARTASVPSRPENNNGGSDL